MLWKVKTAKPQNKSESETITLCSGSRLGFGLISWFYSSFQIVSDFLVSGSSSGSNSSFAVLLSYNISALNSKFVISEKFIELF